MLLWRWLHGIGVGVVIVGGWWDLVSGCGSGRWLGLPHSSTGVWWLMLLWLLLRVIVVAVVRGTVANENRGRMNIELGMVC